MDERGISRRGLLLGGAALGAAAVTAGALVEQDVLPGRSRFYRVLGLNGDGAPLPDYPGGRLRSGSFVSEARGGIEVGWTVAVPRSASPGASLPVLLELHGASFDHTSVFRTLGLDRFLNQLVEEQGVEPFVIASADGGLTYWREQPDGTDSSRMLVDELLPLLEAQGHDTSRLSLGGWSMGGYGALRLAGLGEVAVRAVAVMSPAITDMPDGTDPDDDVEAHPERLASVPVRIDCGRGDPFYPVVSDFVDRMDPAPVTGFGPGGHTADYWRSVAPAQLRFVGEHLA